MSSDWQPMETAPQDGTIVEVRSRSPTNPAEFLAGYVFPKGLVAKLWCPVKGQKVGGLPWKDYELNGWRPRTALQPAGQAGTSRAQQAEDFERDLDDDDMPGGFAP